MIEVVFSFIHGRFQVLQQVSDSVKFRQLPNLFENSKSSTCQNLYLLLLNTKSPCSRNDFKDFLTFPTGFALVAHEITNYRK